VERDDQRIVGRGMLARTNCKQPPGIAVREPQLADALERDQREDDDV
jgi:hypothetical protein